MGLVRTHPRVRGKKRALQRKGGFYPTQLSAVSAWLRLANATVTGSGYSSVPDVLGATSPAVQGTDANRPVNSTSLNGLPIALFTDDFLSWPLAAANNGATKNGFACWVQGDNGSNRNLFVIWTGGGGASAAKFDFFSSSGNLSTNVEVGGLVTKASLMSANVWHFLTYEYDGTQGTDAARALVTLDGVVIGTTNTTIPTSQPTPTGNAWIGGFSTIQSWVGAIGPNFWALNRQLTAPERAALMAFEVPFQPNQIPAVSAWLRLASSTISAGEYDIISDVINTNPTAQTDADRKPAAGTAANGLPIMTFDGTDVLTWPLNTAGSGNNGVTKWGIFFFIKPAANVGTRQRVFHNTFVTSSAKVTIDIAGGGIEAALYKDGVNGRDVACTTGITASVWQSVYFAFDGSQSADDTLAMRLFINGVQITPLTYTAIGTGPAMTTLTPGLTGSVLIGGSTDSDTPSSPLLNGVILGPNMYLLTDNLTPAQLALLNAYEVPT